MTDQPIDMEELERTPPEDPDFDDHTAAVDPVPGDRDVLVADLDESAADYDMDGGDL